LYWFAILCLAARSAAFGQSLSVTPSAVAIQAVEGWTVGAAALTVQSAGGWWIRSSGVDWLRVAPDSGTGPATVKVSLLDSALRLKAGEFSTQLTYGARGTETPSGTVTVTLKLLRPRSPRPLYSYADGPHGCRQTPGYDDAATCDVPGEKPPGNFTPPAIGGSYRDPNFGALVRIVTAPTSWHSYSSPSALNAGNQYLLYSTADQWVVGEAFSGRIVRNRIPVGEGSMWDASNPNFLYSIRGARVERYDVKQNRTTVIVDYSKTRPRFSSISNGGAGDTSRDNWISFFAPAEKQVCALNLIAVRTYCASYENRGPVTLDPTGRGTLISKGVDRYSGKRYVILVAHPTLAVFSVNEAAGSLSFEYLAPERLDGEGDGDGLCEPNETCYKGEHADTLEDAQGSQYLVGEMEVNAPCSFGIQSFRLSRPNLLTAEEAGGGARRLATLQLCGGQDPWVDWHLSCAKHAPHCAVSTTYGGFSSARDPNDRTPVKRTAHLSEVFVIRDNGAEVRRLAQHRSMPFNNEDANGYWSTPRASISFDASYVVFDSNFGEPNRQRVAIVETGIR
jgi:hypothetical protein